MRHALVHWLEDHAPVTGALAAVVRGPDHAVAGIAWADGFGAEALEHALRCVADLFPVLQHNQIAPGRVRWVYEKAVFHCDRRADGACLGVFTPRHLDPAATESLEQFFAEFLARARPGAANPLPV